MFEHLLFRQRGLHLKQARLKEKEMVVYPFWVSILGRSSMMALRYRLVQGFSVLDPHQGAVVDLYYIPREDIESLEQLLNETGIYHTQTQVQDDLEVSNL